MSKNYLELALKHYYATWASGAVPYKGYSAKEEFDLFSTTAAFKESYPNNYNRGDMPGHFTGSAMIVNTSLTKVLLTHHVKLGIWLQLGGHADGDYNLPGVALREAHEESGLAQINFANFKGSAAFINGKILPLPFDIDRHLIPARKTEAEHYHYDVRYLLVADENQKVIVSEESHDVKWFTFDEARRVTAERSMHRQFEKIVYLIESEKSLV